MHANKNLPCTITWDRPMAGQFMFYLRGTRSHEHVANVCFHIVWQILLAVMENRHAATVDEKLLEVPANVVRLQAVVCQKVFIGEGYGRRRTVSLQVHVRQTV